MIEATGNKTNRFGGQKHLNIRIYPLDPFGNQPCQWNLATGHNYCNCSVQKSRAHTNPLNPMGSCEVD